MKLIGTPQSTSAGQNRRTYSTILGNATSGDTVFQVTYEQGRVDVFLNGVRLVPDQDFTRTANGIGTFITLVSGISTGDYVDLVGHVGLSSNAVRTDNFVVGTSSTGSGGSYTGSTTVFPVLSSGGDKVNFYLNGVLLDSTDYTVSSSGSTVTLSAAAATSDIVEIQVIGALVSSSSATFDSLAGTFNGTIGSSSSQCAMAAKLSSTHTMTANPQQIPFNTLLVNNIGTLDTSTNTGRWTCDTDGVYYIAFSIAYYSLNAPSLSAYLEATVRKNSAGSSATIGYATLLDHKSNENDVGFNVSACVSLVNTDTVDLSLGYSSSSGAKSVRDYSYFLVWKIA